ncbi:MAG: glycosyltransferase family 4 protein [Akkermansiaceae bacterium]|nr:glycosyltransferase family 4 protein [Akkermansiaceae bacterium]
MRVAIVHYHLDLGGVTRVIEAASLALTNIKIDHVILSSDRVSQQSTLEPSRLKCIPSLGYLTNSGDLTPEMLADSLQLAAKEALGSPPDIWHFHNHSLGKNCLIADVVALLAEAGERVVLQIHDLAEAGRPENYQLIANCRKLYPVSSRVHFAFLNSRDLEIFTHAGLPPQNASLLPNPIIPPCQTTSASITSPILFAPIRGIRRKNLGELIFLSAFLPAGARIAVSRAPKNPAIIPIHDAWQKFAKSQNLPIDFNVVDRISPIAEASKNFDSWIAHSSHFITTSVEEGFGFPFLEAIAMASH